MNNAVHFATDEHTKLHFHTRDVDQSQPSRLKSSVGPRMYLRKETNADYLPRLDVATPYGYGRSEITAFGFGGDSTRYNYLTTSATSSSVLPQEFDDICTGFCLSMFLLPSMFASDFGGGGGGYGDAAMIAGIPGKVGVYQYQTSLYLRLVNDIGDDLWIEMEGGIDRGAWHLVEVQWAVDSVPVMYINGVRCNSVDGLRIVNPLISGGTQFNVAYDSGTGRFWHGAVREISLSAAVVGSIDDTTGSFIEDTDARMYARAMTLFGLATEDSPVPRFVRDTVAWIQTNGQLHKVSPNHPRINEYGVLIEEERTNLVPIPVYAHGDPDEGGWRSGSNGELFWESALDPGRYTVWFEQQHSEETQQALILNVYVVEDSSETPRVDNLTENDSYVLEITGEPKTVILEFLGSGTLNHVQLENGVGRTSPIISDDFAISDDATRAVETLAYHMNEPDLDQEQGRLDIKITPQHTGIRAEMADVALGGDFLGMSLVREEILSFDAAGDEYADAALGKPGLWQAGVTREFHIEWQPGVRMLTEDTLGLVGAADYAGSWGPSTGWFYIGGGADPDSTGADLRPVRANTYFKDIVIDDWVPRYHADLHRFMYRQFGTGGFSEEETSVFRRWRRTEGDALALLARMGDRLKAEAFADTADLMLKEWERSMGVPGVWGMNRDQRREVIANLFMAHGAHDAEIEEQISYLTDEMGEFASVIERHLGDVAWDTWDLETGADIWQMYEYYVKIPKAFYNPSYLELIRWLLGRQEPAHTVGWPIVETEFTTDSFRFEKMIVDDVGDEVIFRNNASRTERDCVGLPAERFEAPQGQWLPTGSIHGDEWEDFFSDITTPSVYIPFYSCFDNEIIGFGNDALNLSVIGPVLPDTSDTACPGLMIAESRPLPSDSQVTMNANRGFTTVAPSDRFIAADARLFNLGIDDSAAFIHVFRLGRLPDPDIDGHDYGILFGARNGVGEGYSLRINNERALYVNLDGTGGGGFFCGTVIPGQWICLLIKIDQTRNGLYDPGVYVYRVGQDIPITKPSDDTFSWQMSGDDAALAMGDPAGTHSAYAHHVYFAAWLREAAEWITVRTLRRFWTALNARVGFDTNDTPDTTVLWPVGDGHLCKYTGRQAPFANLGELREDTDGKVGRAAGIGLSARVVNFAPYSETIGMGLWSDASLSPVPVMSPEGFLNARTVTEAYSFYAAITGAAQGGFYTVSCWIQNTTADTPCQFYGSVNGRFFTGSPNGTVVSPGNRVDYLATAEWQRFYAVFRFDSDPSATVRMGVRPGPNTSIWGLQVSPGYLLGPYFPNYEGAYTQAVERGLVWDMDYGLAGAYWSEDYCYPDDFSYDEAHPLGLRDRGFVSMRINLLEHLIHLREGESKTLLMMRDTASGMGNFGKLWIRRNTDANTPEDWYVPDNEVSCSLRFTLRVGTYFDEIVLKQIVSGRLVETGSGDELEIDAGGWSDLTIEHRVAVAWDMTRPVAGTKHHIALWVDGELMDPDDAEKVFTNDYPDTSPIPLRVTFDRIWLGRPMEYYGQEPDPGETNINGIVREVEILSRHHPGVYTPTRYEMRELEEKKAKL